VPLGFVDENDEIMSESIEGMPETPISDLKIENEA
jgi:hypothetical protein